MRYSYAIALTSKDAISEKADHMILYERLVLAGCPRQTHLVIWKPSFHPNCDLKSSFADYKHKSLVAVIDEFTRKKKGNQIYIKEEPRAILADKKLNNLMKKDNAMRPSILQENSVFLFKRL